MHGISCFLAALTALAALAAPTRNHNTHALTKSPFKVRVPSRHGLTRTPRHEIQRTFAKYGWEIIVADPDVIAVFLGDAVSALPAPFPTSTALTSLVATASSVPVNSANSSASATFAPTFTVPPAEATSSSTTTTSDGDAEVTASPEQSDSEYLAPVTIGGQSFNLDFDTGSADLWVFSTLQPSSEIGSHAAFNPNKSSTWSDYEDASWDISYGDNSGASGVVGFDHVTVGDLTVTKQAVELATRVSSQFEQDTNSDGLLGLAFSDINTVQPASQKTWFANVMDQLDQPLFTADLEDGIAGTYEFGTIDTSKYAGDIHVTPVNTSSGFWQFPSTVYTIGSISSSCTTCSPAIADTGTSLLLVDEDVASAYYAKVSGASYDSSQGGYIYACSTALPDFGIAIGENVATLQGSGLTYSPLGDGSCYGSIQGNQYAGLQIYGDVFFKQFFAVFNAGDKTFGFAAKQAS